MLSCKNEGEGQEAAAAHGNGGNSKKGTLSPPVVPVLNIPLSKRTIPQKQQLSSCHC